MVKNKAVSGMQVILCICLALTVGRGAGAQTLFYSGDQANSGNVDQFGGPGNEQTFTEFKITNAAGWRISSIYSNDFQPAGHSGGATAEWSIRTGMGVGSGGTTLFTGTNAATQTPTLRNPGGNAEYTVSVDISSLGILLGPGTYWLQVSPVGGNTWYNSTTMGANGVNPANDHNGLSFVGGNYIARHTDYSMGINGSLVTPEGSSLLMFAFGSVPFAVGFGHKFRRKKA